MKPHGYYKYFRWSGEGACVGWSSQKSFTGASRTPLSILEG